MAGQGIQYPPPLEDVPIFDPLLFIVPELGPLTEAIADTKYLRFPFAQGTENMAVMNVLGTATFFDAITHQGANTENFTTNQNIIMNGTVGKYIQFPDGTQQTTATIGGGGFISLQQITPTSTLTDISVPIGTSWVRIFAIGFGGVAGTNAIAQGGGGGAGASIIWPNLPVGNTSGSPLPVFSVQIITPSNDVALSWASSYTTGQRIVTLGAGQAGGNAVGSTAGSAGAGGKIDNNNFFGQAGNPVGGQSGGVIPQSAQLPSLPNYFFKALTLGVGAGGFNLAGSPVPPTAGRIYIWSYG